MTYANDMPTTEKVVRTDAGLASELRLSVMRLRRRLAAERDPANPLSMGQMAVLGALYRNGEQSVGELAAHERVRPPSMTRTVNFLADGGYVDRRAHASDGRQVVIALTEEGRAVLLADRAPPRRVAHPAAGRPHRGRAPRAPPRDADPAATGAGRLTHRPTTRPTETDEEDPTSPTFRSLSHRNYRRYFAGSIVSNIGTWMQRVAQDWLVLTIPGNGGAALGITTGLQFLPILLLSPYAGVIADRFPKRRAPPDHPGHDGARRARSSA